MQFGQLLTHLDTTQQMIACSLKDNATLLTQVSASLPQHTQARFSSFSSRGFCRGPFGGTVVWQGFGLSLHTVSWLPWDI